ncbi:MAG: SurA N-terminal domain-containing protein [Candidatus Omnitrophica bacterium]|nr:SurA N-terminal domain-containing protein [Candidatus Omnitrophota bacterium]
MLSKFRSHHIKRVLWGLVIAIVPSFVLWGGISYLRSRNIETSMRIGNQVITQTDFRDYVKMASCLVASRFDYLPLPQESLNDRQAGKVALKQKGLEYALLLWKAQKDNLTVTDQEVVSAIQKHFFPEGGFKQELYDRHLRRELGVEARQFEEYVRKFLLIQKVLARDTKIEINDDEIKELYVKDTQKAKITYLSISFERFKDQVSVTDDEASEYYRANELIFKEPPKVKIRYSVIPASNGQVSAIADASTRAGSLDALQEKFNLEVKETGFIGLNDPIESIGWQEMINQVAFTLKKGRLSPLIELDDKYIIIEKQDERQSFIPPFDTIKGKVIEKVRQQKAKDAAGALAGELLATIAAGGGKDLTALAGAQKLEVKETEYFKYYDYIEGLGLDEAVSKIIFSLGKDEIYEKSLVLSKGVYLVQLKDITLIDEKDFQDEKEKYRTYLEYRKNLIEKVRLLRTIEKEGKLKIYAIPQL